MTTPTFQTAIHEAGHTIARLVTGHGPAIDFASLLAQPEGQTGVLQTQFRWVAGVSDVRPTGEREAVTAYVEQQRANAKLDIIEALAGPIAESRQRKTPWSAIDLHGLEIGPHCIHGDVDPSGDLEAVRTRLNWLHGGAAEQRFHDYWCEALELVRQNWKAIDSFARLLLSHGRLEGEEIGQWWRTISC